MEQIKAGDKVWAWNEETGEISLRPVLQTYERQTEELIHLLVNGEEIITTSTHLFYSPAKGWTQAVELRAGDILVILHGGYVIVDLVQHEILESPVSVYNLNVEKVFIASLFLLVDNRAFQGWTINENGY